MTATADRFGPGRSREELRLVELASGLLLLLDAHRLTGRLPLEVQVQASRLRHAVKLAVQAEAARTAALPRPRRRWRAGTRRRRCGPGSPPSPGSSRARWAGCTCCASATRPPAPTGPLQGNGCRGQYAGHYWGWTDDLIRRISQHRNPRWRGAGRLVQVALAAGLTFELAWLEYPATRGRERRLKNQGSAYRRCPLCRGTGGPLDPAAAVAAIQPSPLPHPPSAGRR